MEIPNHIGLIPDGNRRFSKRLMLKPWKGHEFGYKKFKRLLEWCREYKIKELTIYAFSLENFKRPKKEFNFLMELFKEAFKELITSGDKEKLKNIRIKFIGRLKLFPQEIQNIMYELEEKTKNNKPYKLNLAMAYSGRAEIVDTTKKLIKKVQEGNLKIENINESIFKENLELTTEPDLIIRTSESRLSGFLPYQSAYSEIVFLPKILWPEFNKQDFIDCINKFSSRKRRFGN